MSSADSVRCTTGLSSSRRCDYDVTTVVDFSTTFQHSDVSNVDTAMCQLRLIQLGSLKVNRDLLVRRARWIVVCSATRVRLSPLGDRVHYCFLLSNESRLKAFGPIVTSYSISVICHVDYVLLFQLWFYFSYNTDTVRAYMRSGFVSVSLSSGCSNEERHE